MTVRKQRRTTWLSLGFMDGFLEEVTLEMNLEEREGVVQEEKARKG